MSAGRTDTAPMERRHLLSPPTHWVSGKTMKTNVPRRFAVGREESSSEDDVPDNQVLSVVSIRLVDESRMMPSVEFSHAEYPVEGTDPHGDITVLKNPVHCTEQGP